MCFFRSAYDLDGFGWRSHLGVTPPGRTRHGIGSGGPRWTTTDHGPRPGDDPASWLLAVTPVGTLRKALYENPSTGEVGFVEDVTPAR